MGLKVSRLFCSLFMSVNGSILTLTASLQNFPGISKHKYQAKLQETCVLGLPDKSCFNFSKEIQLPCACVHRLYIWIMHDQPVNEKKKRSSCGFCVQVRTVFSLMNYMYMCENSRVTLYLRLFLLGVRVSINRLLCVLALWLTRK